MREKIKIVFFNPGGIDSDFDGFDFDCGGDCRSFLRSAGRIQEGDFETNRTGHAGSLLEVTLKLILK